MKPSFVIYGNCQAGVLYEATQFMPGVRDKFEVVYFRSFNHPTEGVTPIDPEVMSRCTLFWKQLDESAPFTFDGSMSEGMKEVAFPPVDLGVLWPFQTYDPLFGPEPDYEYGLFPYGDKVLMEVAELGDTGGSTFKRALELVEQRAADLDRYLDIELIRLMRREQSATVRMAAFVVSNFKSERLFWAYNHPTRPLLRELLNRLSAATWPESRSPGHALFRIGDTVFRDWDPLSDLHTPIHPAVAKKLGLLWWQENLRYRFHNGRQLTQKEYARLYLDERIKRQGSA